MVLVQLATKDAALANRVVFREVFQHPFRSQTTIPIRRHRKASSIYNEPVRGNDVAHPSQRSNLQIEKEIQAVAAQSPFLNCTT